MKPIRLHKVEGRSMKPIRLHKQTVQSVQTHAYKNRTLRPARFIGEAQAVWSVTTVSNSVTGKTYEDSYHFATLKDAVTYLKIMASGDHVITPDTWETLAYQLPPQKVKEIEEATGQQSTAEEQPGQAALI